MSHPFHSTIVACFGAALLLATGGRGLCDDGVELRRELEQLRQENKALRSQAHQQESLIEDLSRRVAHIEKTTSDKTAGADSMVAERQSSSGESSRGGVNLGRINISGEGGVALFHSQSEGVFPNTEFRVDEAKIFVEAPIWEDVYFFTELNLATRESEGLSVDFGEVYLDFENVSQLWGHDRQLNVRVGRMDVPFGEEYQYRDAIDNPLISHSLSDLWGVDEGVEIYGSFGPASYVVAVQNGGVSESRDFNSDKSVAGRLAFDPNRWLHLSVSAMRTGDLDANNDFVSEIWFGGGWFRSIGSANTTTFRANLVQGDVALKFARGHLRAFGGFAQYHDNDPGANNRRDLYYYAIEGVCEVTKKFYAASRFSQIFVNKGYPLPGQGDIGQYFFNPFGPRAGELWRCSLGVGYRFSPRLIVKTEYSLEGGKEAGGGRREHVDLFAVEAAFGF